MKTLFRIFVLMLAVATIASCKKDEASSPDVQRPELNPYPKPHPTAIIEVSNESTREADEIDQVFLFTGEVIIQGLPVKTNEKAQFTAMKMGNNTVHVIVEGPGNNSVVLVDSDGNQYCKNVTTSGTTIVRFDNVNIVGDKKVSITYYSTPCLK